MRSRLLEPAARVKGLAPSSAALRSHSPTASYSALISLSGVSRQPAEDLPDKLTTPARTPFPAHERVDDFADRIPVAIES
jgi:hypothetical protein